MIRFALITDTPKVSGGDLYRMAKALEASALACWSAWHRHLEPWMLDLAPSVVPWDDHVGFDNGRPLPGWNDIALGHLVPIYFLDNESRDARSLAVHYVQGDRPAARVYVENASGLATGRESVCEAASHEIVEMVVNPWIGEWVTRPGRPGDMVAIEVADPVQDHYTFDAHGVDWPVANFVYPAWFGLPGEIHTGDALDVLGTIGTPGDIGPEGYAIIRDHDWRIRYEFGAKRDGFNARQTNAKAHALCRTRRIIEHAHGMAGLTR